MKATLQQRFDDKVSIEPNSGCWLWTGTASAEGYGAISVAGRMVLAHRVSWELHRTPLRTGECVLHHCDNPSCVNPGHLFVGSLADNSRDMTKKGRQFGQRKTHCIRGHALAGDNLMPSALARGHRQCLACNRAMAGRNQRVSA